MTNKVDFTKGERIATEAIEKIIRATALKVLGIVDLRTPVDQGTLRGNNLVSLDTPTTSPIDRQDPNGNTTKNEINAVLSAYTIQNTIIMTNPLDYAIHVEDGTSTFRGAFMYRAAIAAADTALKQAAAGHKIGGSGG